MSDIADVIGWKFGYQPGMRCKAVKGALVLVEFPGGVPDEAIQNGWRAEYAAFVENGGLADREAEQVLDLSPTTKVLIDRLFDQETRLRALEKASPVTEEQYHAALVNAWKDV